jgi:uncharacterized protein with HEPN domain
MQRDLCAYLQDVLDAADAISVFTNGLTFETFASTDLTLSGVKYKLEVIGEGLKQASRHFPESLAAVKQAKFAIQLRDRITHGYFSVDPRILWSTVKEDLPLLIEQVERLKAASCS